MMRLGPALLVAAMLAGLACAGGVFAANTATIAVWHTPMVLSGSKSTTLDIGMPQSTDPIAAVNIYVPAGYRLDLAQAPGTAIGEVTATAFSRDESLTLPLSGTVTTAAAAAHTADSMVCTGIATSAAVWDLDLSVAGQSIVLPVYVNPTAGAEQALGAYRISVCLPPPDVAPGTPGRAVEGAQVLETQLTVNGVFTTPSTGGLLDWNALFTPYLPGQGTPNLAGTFEARAIVPTPILLAFHTVLAPKKRSYTVKGTLAEGGLPTIGAKLAVLAGPSAAKLKVVASLLTGGGGSFKVIRPLKRARGQHTLYLQARSSVAERDFTAVGCQNAATTAAPAGCVSATLSPWTFASPLTKLKLR